MKRRDVIKGLTLLPIAGGALSAVEPTFAAMRNGKKLDWFSSEPVTPGPLKIGPQIYQSIGVEPVINCRGTFTIIGASVVRPEAREAMEHAHQYNVQLDELAYGVGQRLAEITGAEWGVVSSGCSGGLKIVAIGAVTGGSPEKLIRIPMDTMSFEKNEVIMVGGSVYDHAIRNIGVKVRRVNNVADIAAAINPKTALVYMGSEGAAGGVAAVSAVVKPKGIPLLVDAAANRLTIPDVHLAAGADVVAYSGGKCINGPQSAGLLLGKKGLLQAAWQASSPHHGPARDNKVGREEQIGMLAAVESWVTRNHEAEMAMWVSWMQHIATRVGGLDSVVSNVRVPSKTSLDNATPGLTVTWDPTKLNITAREVANELSTTSPRIALSANDQAPGGAGGRGGAAAGAAGAGGRGGAGAPGAAGAAGGQGGANAGAPGAVAAGGGGGRGGAAASVPFVPGGTNNPVPPANTASLSIAAYQMSAGQEKVVADRIFQVLSRKRASLAAVAPMKAPAADITGRWNVTVEYFNSKSEQIIVVEKQDGNFLNGTHRGDLSTREMTGNIDGDRVVFQSSYRPVGDQGSAPYTFAGTLSGDTMTGVIDLGEYINAKFTARKHTYPQFRQRINVPVGRPLSS